MTYAIPTERPAQLTAGTTWTWTESLSEYPIGEGWTLTSTCLGTGGAFTLTATTSGSLYRYDVLATETALFLPGTYQVIRRVTKGAEIRAIDSSYLVLLLNPATSTSVDGTEGSYAEQMLTSVEARIKARLTDDLASYSLAGRSAQKEALRELYGLRSKFALEVWRERNPGRSSPTTEVVFASI
jgi:hypothetical protein